MDVPALLDRDGLLAAWRRLVTGAEFGQQDRCELDERGEVVMNLRPSARRQIVLTDVYCHVTEQMWGISSPCVPVITPSFGIRVPDVVWMSCDKCEGFDRDEPVPFVPDLCVEVLLDSDRSHDIDRRVTSYLAGGATEVIVVCHSGKVEFWDAAGRTQASVFGIAPSLDDMYFEENGGVAPAPSVRS